MIVWLTAVVFAVAVTLGLARVRVSRGICVLVLCGVSVLVAGAAWRLAFPSRSVDFDTWAELSRWKLGRTWELIKPHRPLQYYGEYIVVRWLGGFGTDERQARAVLVAASLVAAYLVIHAFRRLWFGSALPWLPAAWATGFLLTPGGAFLADSWNDHAVLVPFYLAGLGVMGGWPRSPGRTATILVVLLTVQSAFHTAEPWLWAAALGAVIWSRPLREKGLAIAAAAAMIAVGLAIISRFPGGALAGKQYVAMYQQDRFHLETLKVFAFGFAEGGGAVVRARFLIPAIAAVLAAWAAMAVLRRSFADRVLLVALLAAVAFPLVYETENPERYYTLAVLWPLIGLRALKALPPMGRLARRQKRTPAMAALLGGPAVIAGLMLGGLAVSAPVLARTLDEEHTYNHHGALLGRSLDPRGTLVVVPEGAFYLWMEWWYRGRVRVVEDGEDPAVVLRDAGPAPVYFNEGVRKSLPPEVAKRSVKVFERPGDPASFVYLRAEVD